MSKLFYKFIHYYSIYSKFIEGGLKSLTSELASPYEAYSHKSSCSGRVVPQKHESPDSIRKALPIQEKCLEVRKHYAGSGLDLKNYLYMN